MMKRTIFKVVAYSLLGIILVSPLLWPKVVYFRGWEYLDDLVFTGYESRQITLYESGDSTREYLLQRYRNLNQVSVNSFGNRISEYAKNESFDVLAIGDSQMFGSGVSDEETFPSQLNKYSEFNVYNASRINGLSILNTPSIDGDWKYVIVSSTERNGFSWYCNSDGEFVLPSSGAIQLPRKSKASVHYFQTIFSRMQGFVDQKYQSLISGKFIAPKGRVITNVHEFNAGNLESDLACMGQISRTLSSRDLTPIFLLFPANQSLYPEVADPTPGQFTRNYIETLEIYGVKTGIQVIDSLQCLKKTERNVSSLHDTHLNEVGFRLLALCTRDFISRLEKLQRN